MISSTIRSVFASSPKESECLSTFGASVFWVRRAPPLFWVEYSLLPKCLSVFLCYVRVWLLFLGRREAKRNFFLQFLVFSFPCWHVWGIECKSLQFLAKCSLNHCSNLEVFKRRSSFLWIAKRLLRFEGSVSWFLEKSRSQHHSLKFIWGDADWGLTHIDTQTGTPTQDNTIGFA